MYMYTYMYIRDRDYKSDHLEAPLNDLSRINYISIELLTHPQRLTPRGRVTTVQSQYWE